MRSRFFSITIGTIGIVAFVSAMTINWNDSPSRGFSLSAAAAEDAPPPPMPADDTGTATPAGAEVLAQGPVHEAFANPIDVNPQPGQIVAKRPPDPVEEIPPEQQPEGDNIVWIPGYWAWDDDRTNFLWVSGVLRNAPPGQTWVPGYWSEVNGGYQWTPGFWTAAAKEQVQYLPAPPQSLETQATPSPGENFFWIPGCWMYRDRYAWRPGYWTACRPNWIWNPAHYSWTPCGFVFIDGYWDYAIARRGCLFAPVYFNQPLYAQAGFVWTPSVLINVGLFTDHLFVRPSFCHYYFGDFYATRYAGLGFQPWFSVSIGGGRRYDPLFTYYRWNNSRTDRNWLANTQRHFEQLQKNESLRPPHTFVAQETLLKRGGAATANAAVVTTISQLAKDPGQSPFKFHNVDQRDRQVLANNGKELQKVSQERVQIERTNKGSGNLGVGGADIAGDKQNNGTLGKGWKLPTAASSKITLSAQNQNNNSGGNNTFGDGNRTQKDSRLLGNTNNSNNNSTSGAGRGNLTDSAGNKNNQNGAGNSFLNRDRTGSMLGQGGNSNLTGSTGAGRGNSAGTGGVQSNPLGAGNSTGTTNSARSALTDGGRSFVPQQGSGGRTGGLQSGGIQSGGLQSQGVVPGLPSLGNGPRLGGQFPLGGNGTSGGNSNLNSNNPTPRIQSPSGSSGGAGSGNNSGGNGARGSGSGSQQGGRDRDDKGKNSSLEAPRTDMNLQPGKSSVADVREVMKQDHATISQATQTPSDLVAKELKTDSKIDMGRDDAPVVDYKPSSETPRDRSLANQTADPTRIQLPTTTFRLRSLLPSGDSNGMFGMNHRGDAVNQPGADQLRGTSGIAGGRGTSSDDGYGSPGNGGKSTSSPAGPKITASPDPHPANGASLSKYNYQNLRDRGRSLSDRVAGSSDGAGSPTETPDVNTLRRVKDPVATVGLGGDRTIYGPGGVDGSPAPSSTTGLDDRPAGLGSYSSSATLPRMSHFDTRLDRHSSQAPVNDAAARTYDPARGGY
jgi:hypothetical protein